MALEQYDPSGIPEIFGLRNSGVLCYLNSLIQSLVSCSAFNRFLIANRIKYADNPVVTEYLKLLSRNAGTRPDSGINPAPSRPGYRSSYNIDDAFGILRELKKTLDTRKSGFNLSFFRQEDIHEGLTLLLDSIPESETLFNVRYTCRLYCRSCKHIATPGDSGHEEPSEVCIHLSDDSPALTKESVENKIKINMQIPQDYKCEKCGVKNELRDGEPEANILQVYRLVRLSEILVITFKKYNGKKMMYFPPTLEFKSNSRTLQYRIVSVVNHFGNNHSGHYNCECLRRIPDGLFKSRKLKAEKIIQQLQARITGDKNRNQIQEMEDKIQSIRREIAGDNEKNTLSTFLFDDEMVRYSGDFTATPNTYVVFYHLD